MTIPVRFMVCAVLALLLAGGGAWAADGDPSLVGKYGAWSVYRMKDKGADVCYMMSEALDSSTSAKSPHGRGRHYVMVTERPIEHSYDVVSYIAGTPLKHNSQVSVTIDKKQFSLFTDGSTAWNKEASGDLALTAALRAGKMLKIDAESAKKHELHDAYSLKGVSAAYDSMAQACGMPIPPHAAAKSSKSKRRDQ